MDRPVVFGFNLAEIIQRRPHDIEKPSQRSPPYRHFQSRAGIDGFSAALQAIGRRKGQTPYPVIAEVVLHFQHDFIRRRSGFQ